jgi:hypothetical protein
MKFFKMMVALALLIGMQNSLLFGEVTPELEDIKGAAVRVLKKYDTTTSTQRTPESSIAARNALAVMRMYQDKGGQLTSDENRLVAKVTNMPGIRTRVVRTRAGAATPTPAVRAVTEPQATTETAGRTRVVRTRAGAAAARPVTTPVQTVRLGAEEIGKATVPGARTSVVRTRGAAAQPGRITERTRITAEAPRRTRIVRTRGGVVRPMMTAANTLDETVAYWFGGDLSPLFRNGVINTEMLQIAFDNIKEAQEQTNFTDGQVFQMINNAILANKVSEITAAQRRMIMDAFAATFEKPVLTGRTSIEQQLNEEGITAEEATDRAIDFWFGGDLNNFYGPSLLVGGLNLKQEEVEKAANDIKQYQALSMYTNEQVRRKISMAAADNEESGIDFKQRSALVKAMHKLFPEEE